MSAFLKKLSEIDNGCLELVGGKALSLARLKSWGFSVPNAYIVTTNLFKDLVLKNNSKIRDIVDSIEYTKYPAIENASKDICDIINKIQIPDSIIEEIMKKIENLNSNRLAIRSSATTEDGKQNTWAGQLETFLYLDKSDIKSKIPSCWASLFSPRCILYRHQNGMDHEDIAVAVILQEMIESEKSGIAFSIDPISEDLNTIMIEAGLGLGESIVSGQITPDRYLVSKESKEIIEKHMGRQKKAIYPLKGGSGTEWKDVEVRDFIMTEKEIVTLANATIKIESLIQSPCDVEWGLSNNHLYILQARPITTL